MSNRSTRMDSPRVTWLLPVRDAMPYLPETLASIEAQTYRNWEVLAWDNGSTDGSLDELRRWIPARLPGRVVSDQPLPLGSALARMVEACDTELCARIDGDDVSLPHRLERQVDFLLRHPEVAVVGSQITEIDSEGVPCRRVIGPLPVGDDEIVRDMLRTPGIAHPTVLFRRSAVLEAGNYRFVGPVNVEDYDLWLRIAARHKVANLEEPLLRYRIHEQSATVIALREGSLQDATTERFIENAAPLFGCSTEDARRLAERRHPFAFAALLRIAMHLRKRSGTGVISTLRCPRFQFAAHELIGARHLGDAVSHLALASFSPEPGALRREAMVLTRALLRRLGRAAG